jgi:hypothetical protein
MNPTKYKWSADNIRQARKTDLVPLLTGRGYLLQPATNGNFRIMPNSNNPASPAGLIVKLHFWLWPEQHIAGNTIDFFMKIEGLSFNDAMRLILGKRL